MPGRRPTFSRKVPVSSASGGASAEEHVIVTDLEELDVTELTPIEEALALIDQGLGGLTERQLVSASEVADLLLDVRSLLSDGD